MLRTQALVCWLKQICSVLWQLRILPSRHQQTITSTSLALVSQLRKAALQGCRAELLANKCINSHPKAQPELLWELHASSVCSSAEMATSVKGTRVIPSNPEDVTVKYSQHEPQQPEEAMPRLPHAAHFIDPASSPQGDFWFRKDILENLDHLLISRARMAHAG